LCEAVLARDRSYGRAVLARVQLAKAALMDNRLDASFDALVLDPERRISSLSEHLKACRQLPLMPGYRGSSTALELEQQLAAFSAASTARALPSGAVTSSLSRHARPIFAQLQHLRCHPPPNNADSIHEARLIRLLVAAVYCLPRASHGFPSE
jgi:hypothetical protein